MRLRYSQRSGLPAAATRTFVARSLLQSSLAWRPFVTPHLLLLTRQNVTSVKESWLIATCLEAKPLPAQGDEDFCDALCGAKRQS